MGSQGEDMAQRVKATKASSAPDEMASTPLPRIFVRIPAYRDPETLPTVERLFERADHPERVSVGVCWQYGPDEGPLPVPIRFGILFAEGHRAQTELADL